MFKGLDWLKVGSTPQKIGLKKGALLKRVFCRIPHIIYVYIYILANLHITHFFTTLTRFFIQGAPTFNQSNPSTPKEPPRIAINSNFILPKL